MSALDWVAGLASAPLYHGPPAARAPSAPSATAATAVLQPPLPAIDVDGILPIVVSTTHTDFPIFEDRAAHEVFIHTLSTGQVVANAHQLLGPICDVPGDVYKFINSKRPMDGMVYFRLGRRVCGFTSRSLAFFLANWGPDRQLPFTVEYFRWIETVVLEVLRKAESAAGAPLSSRSSSSVPAITVSAPLALAAITVTAPTVATRAPGPPKLAAMRGLESKQVEEEEEEQQPAAASTPSRPVMVQHSAPVSASAAAAAATTTTTTPSRPIFNVGRTMRILKYDSVSFYIYTVEHERVVSALPLMQRVMPNRKVIYPAFQHMVRYRVKNQVARHRMGLTSEGLEEFLAMYEPRCPHLIEFFTWVRGKLMPAVSGEGHESQSEGDGTESSDSDQEMSVDALVELASRPSASSSSAEVTPVRDPEQSRVVLPARAQPAESAVVLPRKNPFPNSQDVFNALEKAVKERRAREICQIKDSVRSGEHPAVKELVAAMTAWQNGQRMVAFSPTVHIKGKHAKLASECIKEALEEANWYDVDINVESTTWCSLTVRVRPTADDEDD